MPGEKQRLPDQRRLLVAGHPGDRDRVAEQLGRRRPRNRRRCRASRAAARAGCRRRRSSSSSQARRCRSNSIVRDAFVTSVACSLPPVSRHNRKLSIVPNAISPASARSRRPGDVVEQPADFRRREIRVDDETGAAAPPSRRARRSRQRSHSSRGAPVLPDDRVVHRAAGARSHSTVVSRWLVMPIAAIGRPRAAAIASRQVATTRPPDFLRIVLDPARAADRSGAARRRAVCRMPPAASNRIARVLVVP